VTVVEAADFLAISRNDVKQLPIKRHKIKNSFYYVAKDVRLFPLENPNDELLLRLRAKKATSEAKLNTGGRRREAEFEAEKRARSGASHVEDVPYDIEELEEKLKYAPWPASEDVEEIRQEVLALRQKYPNVPRPRKAWWLIDEDDKRDGAHRKCRAKILDESIQFNERLLTKGFDPSRFDEGVTEGLWRKELSEEIVGCRQELARIARHS
jgi:hypothetical protein